MTSSFSLSIIMTIMYKLKVQLRDQLFITLLITISLPLFAWSKEGPPVINSERVHFNIRSEYFRSSSNYDPQGGAYEGLPNGQSYANLLTSVMGQYSWSDRWAVFSKAGLAYAKSNGADTDRTNTQITELGGGLRHKLLVRPVFVVPEIEFGFPLNRVKPSTDETLTDEGALFLQAGGWFAKHLWHLYNYAYLGARYQDEGRASLWLYKIGTYINLNGVLIGTELNGYSALTNDTYLDTPEERDDITTRVNAGSLRYYSINPSLAELRFWTGFRFLRGVQMDFGYNQTINGKNTAAGRTFWTQLTWSWNLSGETPSRRTKRSFQRKSEQQAEEFNIDAEKYDETLFEDKPTSTPKKREQKKKTEQIENQLLDEAEDFLD